MRLPRRAELSLVAALFTLLPAAVAHAGPATDPNHPELSEVLATMAKPSLRDASPAEQARAVDLPAQGPGSLPRLGDRVGVQVFFTRGAAAAGDELRAAGADVRFVSRRYQSVSAMVDPANLRAIADVPG